MGTVKMFRKLLKWFAVIWSALVVITILISIFGMVITSNSFYEACKRITSTFSPFNIANFIVTLIALSPAIGAYVLYEYLEKKTRGDRAAPEKR